MDLSKAASGSGVNHDSPCVQFADIPVMASYLVLIALFFVVINLIVDILYHVVDPRLRIERQTSVE